MSDLFSEVPLGMDDPRWYLRSLYHPYHLINQSFIKHGLWHQIVAVRQVNERGSWALYSPCKLKRKHSIVAGSSGLAPLSWHAGPTCFRCITANWHIADQDFVGVYENSKGSFYLRWDERAGLATETNVHPYRRAVSPLEDVSLRRLVRLGVIS